VGRVQNKVALITGAARGQGRSHAVRLAEEGADIIAIDIAGQIDTVPYPMATPDDLAETAELVKKHGRRVLAVQADIREFDQLISAVEQGVDELGQLDIVCANAGIIHPDAGRTWEHSEQQWMDVVGVNLTGTWNTVRAVVPWMLQSGRPGSIILTSSVAGLKGVPHTAGYTASKHGVVGLMRTLALELAASNIRVNTVNPGNTMTPMVLNEPTYRLMRPDLPSPGREQAAAILQQLNPMPVPWVAPIDISNAVLWLASDESRYVTGTTVVVDAGQAAR
jgi:(+)-trans-carveol dehydrogenase